MKFLILTLIALSLAADAETIQSYVDLELQSGMTVVGGRSGKKKRAGGLGGSKVTWSPIQHELVGTQGNSRYTTDSKAIFDASGIVITGWSNEKINKIIQDMYLEHERCKENNKQSKKRKNSECSFEYQERYIRQLQYQQQTYGRNLRSTSIDLKFFNKQNNSNILVTLEDKQLHTSENLPGGYSLKYTNDFIRGKIKLGLKMPKNTWAVIAHVKKREGIFELQNSNIAISSGFNNSFNNNLNISGNYPFLVWAKPETETSLDIAFNNYSQGSNLSGSIEIEIQHINLDSYKAMSSQELFSEIVKVSNTYSSINSFQQMLNLSKPFIALISNQPLVQKLTAELKSKDVFTLSNAINRVTYASDANPYIWDIKAAASIVGFEIALEYLKSISPFCQQIELELPFTKNRIKTTGLKYASFLANKSFIRIQSQNFAPFKILIDILREYQNKGLTYSQVRNESEVFLKLKKATDLLVSTVDMRTSHYSDLFTELDYIYKTYGTVGAPGSDNKDLMNLAQSMQSKDVDFYTQFLSKLREFQDGNMSNVNIDDIAKSFEQLMKNQNLLNSMIQDKVKLVFSSENEENGTAYLSLSEGMLALVTHNIDILTEPLSASFEPLRAAYVSTTASGEILESVKGCMR